MRVIVDYLNKEKNRRQVLTFTTTKSFEDAVRHFQEKIEMAKDVVQYVDSSTGESIKGALYDTIHVGGNVYDIVKNMDNKDTPIKPPVEDTQYEPRDRVNENKNMNVNKFRNLVKECIAEVKQENDPKSKLKESLRSVVKSVLTEISNTTKPKPDKAEKEKEDKGYAKDRNERVDKVNEKQKNELETIVHGINKDWQVYWDDHNQLVIDANNMLYVRICPKFENNYDIDAMVKLCDRLRVIAVTWEQVKDFVKANFTDLENKTIPDKENQKSWDNYKDRDKDSKDAGPRHDIPTLRTGNVKDTKRDDKMYNEPQVKKDEDLPSAPMKDVKDVEKGLNHDIKKTDHVKPPKHKNDKALKVDLKKTKKFGNKRIN